MGDIYVAFYSTIKQTTPEGTKLFHAAAYVLAIILIVYFYHKQGDPGVRGPMGNPGKEGPKVGETISDIKKSINYKTGVIELPQKKKNDLVSVQGKNL